LVNLYVEVTYLQAVSHTSDLLCTCTYFLTTVHSMTMPEEFLKNTRARIRELVTQLL